VKGPFLLAAFLLGFFDHALHWGRLLFAAATLACLFEVLCGPEQNETAIATRC
jgi:hypothetical protein